MKVAIKTIYVKEDKTGWVVTNKRDEISNKNTYTRTTLKTDALRYAHACEQRTGVKVVILSD